MTYTSEERLAIISHFKQGEPAKDICNEYGVSHSTFYRWTHDCDESISNSENVQSLSVRDYSMLQRKIKKLENMISGMFSMHTRRPSLASKGTQVSRIPSAADSLSSPVFPLLPQGEVSSRLPPDVRLCFTSKAASPPR